MQEIAMSAMEILMYTSFDELGKAVSSEGGILTLPMWQLRDLNGSGRLGPYVVEAISKELAARGLGHFPSDLPQSQWDKVRVFRLGSTIAEIISLVINVDETKDDRLREITSNEAAEKLQLVRRIVC
jgi:hypothetical protein